MQKTLIRKYKELPIFLEPNLDNIKEEKNCLYEEEEE